MPTFPKRHNDVRGETVCICRVFFRQFSILFMFLWQPIIVGLKLSFWTSSFIPYAWIDIHRTHEDRLEYWCYERTSRIHVYIHRLRSNPKRMDGIWDFVCCWWWFNVDDCTVYKWLMTIQLRSNQIWNVWKKNVRSCLWSKYALLLQLSILYIRRSCCFFRLRFSNFVHLVAST